MTENAVCPFCALPEGRVLFRNARAVAVRDAHPIANGHTLVIPVRLGASFFDATSAEGEGMLVGYSLTAEGQAK